MSLLTGKETNIHSIENNNEQYLASFCDKKSICFYISFFGKNICHNLCTNSKCEYAKNDYRSVVINAKASIQFNDHDRCILAIPSKVKKLCLKTM